MITKYVISGVVTVIMILLCSGTGSLSVSDFPMISDDDKFIAKYGECNGIKYTVGKKELNKKLEKVISSMSLTNEDVIRSALFYSGADLSGYTESELENTFNKLNREYTDEDFHTLMVYIKEEL